MLIPLFVNQAKGLRQRTFVRTTPTYGFTIVELLIVIVIIAILATVTVVAFNGTQLRARDSIRANDIAYIRKMLLAYQVDNGGLPRTATYGGAGPGGWNISSSASWLSFLGTTYGKVPSDPVNTGITDPGGAGAGLAYFYYCYDAGSGMLPATANVSIGYKSEVANTSRRTNFSVERCL
ncbi:hypothetical protein B7Z00_02470 [Candidatus Saccharibacteria bacterium 32-50-10]|nr:MAG: hypothetical protein B7Z00_02470 [Candidatus Saccharibacteria bacterium 32-50-10]